MATLNFGLRKDHPIILQSESSECGLACISMILNHYGSDTDINGIRSIYSISSKGMDLTGLMSVAEKMHLHARPLKLQLNELQQLRLPCILHWDFNHFVVLYKVDDRQCKIADPAIGLRKMPLSEVDKHFTGVAIELWPMPDFIPTETKNSLSIVGHIRKTKGYYRSLTNVIAISVLIEVCVLLSPLFMQLIIDDIIPSRQTSLLPILAIGFGLVVVIDATFTAFRAWQNQYLATHLALQWQSNIFDHLVHLPTSYFERRHSGDVISKFSSIDAIYRTLTGTFISGFLNGVFSLCLLVVLLLYNYQLTLAYLLCVLIYSAIKWMRYRYVKSKSTELLISSSKMSTQFIETIKGIRTVKSFQRESHRKNVWQGHLVASLNGSISIEKVNIFYGFVSKIILGLAGIGILYFGVNYVLSGAMTIGAFVAFNTYRLQFSQRVLSLVDIVFSYKLLDVHIDRVSDIITHKPERSTGLLSNEEFAKPALTVEADNIWFRYSDNDNWIVKGVSLYAKEGESIAVIGISGAGKSTFLNLLSGSITPSQGKVKIAGEDFELDRTLRKYVSCVYQDDTLFAGSYLENITFFDPNPDVTWAIECARISQISGEIEKMPMKYNTLVGDMGSSLSGGQRQRLILARALYRRPKILLMDEPTSNLNSALEKRVFAEIAKLDVTRILITHRTESLASFDRVLTFNDGQLS